MEDPLSHDPAYPCCTFRGNVVSLDAATGKMLWKSYGISKAPQPLHEQTSSGTELYGPAGGAIYAPLTTPSTDTLSAQWDINDAFRLYGDVQLTGWDSLEQVAIYRDGGTALGPAEAFDWKNTTYVSIGGEWDLSDAFTLRAGIAHDESPTNDTTRTPRLPDDTRMLYSIGATWHATEALSIDAAYQRITIDDPTVDVASSSGSRLTGSFDGHADLFGLAARYRF